MGISLSGPPIKTPIEEEEYQRGFAAVSRENVDTLMVGDAPENFTNRRLIAKLAEEASSACDLSFPRRGGSWRANGRMLSTAADG